MNADEFQRVEAVFDDAMARPEAERLDFLESTCAGEPEVRAQVARLLRFADRNLALAAIADDDPDDHEPPDGSWNVSGRWIGPYRLVQKLGEGGFGVVYEAEQDQPVRRRVAVKLIKPGMDSQQVVERFKAERQALALMDHPNIARVLHAGATDWREGARPYFVMELVPGVPVTRYADTGRLDIADRLKLFITICHAVQHAHQKGVIHRDLKPSNVMVAEGDDGSPVPKIIDFGIAKAIREPLNDGSWKTNTSQMIGTPQYMSPEQAGSGESDVDTRSDVYSLGVLLYELLTGATPFGYSATGGVGEFEIRRIIREVEPVRPSASLREPVDETESKRLSAICDARGMDSTGLRRRVRGELDWIVMKALEKDRDRRYDSASGLAADVQRYLDHEPLIAGPPSATYRVRKFVRRNSGAVVAVSAVALTLIIGAGLTTLFAVGQAMARSDADQHARTTVALNTFLIGEMLKAPGNRGIDVTLREVLDEASTKVETEFAGDPHTEAMIRATLGSAYIELTEPGQAMPHLERALRLRMELLGPEHVDTLRSKGELASAHEMLGGYDRSIELYHEMLAVGERVLGIGHPDVLTAHGNLGYAYFKTGNLAEGERVLLETLTLIEQAGESPTIEYRAVLNNLASVYLEQGRIDEAIALHERELAMAIEELGPEDRETLISRSNVAMLRYRLARYDEAIAEFREILAIQRRVLGDTHDDTLSVINNLGTSLLARGELDESVELLAEVSSAWMHKHGPDHASTLDARSNLASALRNLRRIEEAEIIARDTLVRRRDALTAEHPDTLRSLVMLASILSDLERYGEAEMLGREALELRIKILSEEHPSTLVARNNLSSLYRKLDRPAEALEVIGPAVELSRSIMPTHPNTAIIVSEKGDVLVMLGRFEEAEPLFGEAVEIVGTNMAADHWIAATVQARYGSFLVKTERYDDAEPILLASYDVLVEARGPDDQRTQKVIESLITLFGATDRADDALRWAERRIVQDPTAD